MKLNGLIHIQKNGRQFWPFGGKIGRFFMEFSFKDDKFYKKMADCHGQNRVKIP
ncbi:hypothetical protein FD37_GL002345 [Levilactobacillus spicheri DSM 15429]|uniref:Uncharacterized protein n=1 Tax=Levilactobacillus spicheri DSM 15429 TaxID=1423805 RepID=A0A0R1QZF2_9LACO|nr:hypothetical protein FD37_GL002345 [Levilactobacillus spicheri DSM 15429]